MHDVDDRAETRQILVAGAPTDLDMALPRRLIAHLIADRVAKIPGDHELVRRLPGDRRGHLDRPIMLVEDARPPDGELAEDGLEGEWSSPLPLDAGTGFAVPPLEFEADLMDVGLDLVGEMLVLGRHGQGHLE
jgi:hypothetical protein